MITPLESDRPSVKKEGQLQLEQGQTYRFSVHSLDTHTYEVLVALARSVKEKVFSLHTAILRLEHIEPVDRPVSYEALIEESFQKLEQERITFAFLTPTSFRRQNLQQLFPTPELVFGSLLKRWNHFSPIPFPGDGEHKFSEIPVNRYELKTQLLTFSAYKIIGFRGRVVYQIPKNMPAYTKMQIAALSTFARYAGVGYKTTMGLGCVQVE